MQNRLSADKRKIGLAGGLALVPYNTIILCYIL